MKATDYLHVTDLSWALIWSLMNGREYVVWGGGGGGG